LSPVVPDGGDGEAVVVAAEVSAGHDGEAELTSRLLECCGAGELEGLAVALNARQRELAAGAAGDLERSLEAAAGGLPWDFWTIDLAAAADINLTDINAYSSKGSADQVTSINQFSDVRPTDWAFQALSNLIDNAMHHGPVGTHITVRVGAGWLEVQDDGPGIAPEHQAHVFERFYRAAPSGVNGSGLGLAIVQEIANQHGAVMHLISPVGDGHGTVIRMSWTAS
jgi:signal transduction histidine kinase